MNQTAIKKIEKHPMERGAHHKGEKTLDKNADGIKLTQTLALLIASASLSCASLF